MNPAGTQEVVIDTAAVNAELDGGRRPGELRTERRRESVHGNNDRILFHKSLQSSNFTQELKDKGCPRRTRSIACGT
jgi:hypothetical protein